MRRSLALTISALLLLSLASFASPSPIPDQSANTRESTILSWDNGFGEDENTGAYMGVDIADITAERLSALKLKDERGVEVTMVDQDAPAGKAGLKEHDVILTMNDTKVESGAQLRRMIRETPAGRIVTLGISRDGQPLTLKVQLADRRKSPAWSAHQKDFKFEMPAMPRMPDFDVPVSVVVVHSSIRSGLMVENITPQLGEFFGVKDGRGVLVRAVEKGSRADKSGFRAGDVIVRVNDQPVHDTSDFSHAIRSTNSGSVTVGIIREKREQNLTLPLPERKDSGEMLDESFDFPDFDVEANLDWAKMENELAALKPQLQYAIEESNRAVQNLRPEIEKATREAREEVERQRPEIERAIREAQSAASRAREELCKNEREMREQTRKLQKEVQKQRKEILRENRKLRERLQHELHGDWMQI